MVDKIMLTKEDQEKLENIEGDVDNLEGELNRAARAGIDITVLKTDFTKMKDLRAGLLREYGSND